MFDLRLTYQGNGLFRVATKEDARIAQRQCDVGEQIKAHCTKRFTVTQSALFQSPPVNAFGAITSNGVRGTLGGV